MTRPLRAVPDDGIRCEQFCTEPIGPDGDPGSEDFRACCPRCDLIVDWLSDEVLPSIFRHGYYAPTGSTVEAQAVAMASQAGLRGGLLRVLSDLGVSLDGGAC